MPEKDQKYAEIIRQLVPVNELPPEVQNEIIKNAFLIEVKKKDYLFKQGDRDNYSYYLLQGEIELEANKQVHNSIISATDRARYPMAQLQPRQFSGKAKVASVVLRIERNSLDKLLVMHQGKNDVDDGFGDGLGSVELDVVELDDEESIDWMTRMLQSEIFSGMPTANIHKLFSLLEPREYKAGDVVISQGESGQHYYIIQEGRCEVSRKAQEGSKEIRLAELRAGDGFGEEALIAETTRNATIRMLTDGVVGQLSKDDFITLIQQPVLKAVSSVKAQEIVDAGGKWLDVRYKNEHDRGTIKDCEHVPLNILRMQVEKLDKQIHYVLFCDTGGRSSTAAFLLTDRGFLVSYLEGGLVNHPELASAEDVTQVPVAPAVPVPEKREEPDAKTVSVTATPPVAAPVPGPEEEMDPEIMATVLDAELTRADMRLESARKQDRTEKKNIEIAKKLEEERAKIAAERKRIETEVLKMRKQEEERLKKLEQEAEKRMQQERKKIEEVYSRNAEEMEKLEKLRQEAKEKLNREKSRIEKEAEEARKNKQDAVKIKQELEAARKAMEAEAEKHRLELEVMKKNIESQARKKIEAERRKLAEQFARNNQEVEKARREKAIAEAGRLAAKQEAELMIEEYKSRHDKSRAEEEEKIRAERLKLEAEQQKIQQALQDIQRVRAEAETLRRAALAEVTALKAKQFQEEIARDKNAKAELQDRIKNAQDKLARASENIAQAEQQEEKAVVAQKVNQEDLSRKKAEEEVLRKQLEEDLKGFKEELEEQEKKYASATTQLEHMRRIKERAEMAKRQAEDSAEDLLSDVAAQLGDKK